jgi:hypothetical protein
MNSSILYNIIPCGPVKVKRRFGEISPPYSELKAKSTRSQLEKGSKQSYHRSENLKFYIVNRDSSSVTGAWIITTGEFRKEKSLSVLSTH